MLLWAHVMNDDPETKDHRTDHEAEAVIKVPSASTTFPTAPARPFCALRPTPPPCELQRGIWGFGFGGLGGLGVAVSC